MSDFLFSNCLIDFLNISNVQSLSTISVMFGNKFNNFSNFCFLHAVDTLLVAVSRRTAKELPKNPNRTPTSPQPPKKHKKPNRQLLFISIPEN